MGCKFVREAPRGGRAKSEKSVTFNDNVTAIPPPESEPASLAGSMVNRRTNSSVSPEASPSNHTLSTPQNTTVDDVEVVVQSSDLEVIGRGKIKRRNDSLSLAAVRRSRRTDDDDDADAGGVDDAAAPIDHNSAEQTTMAEK